MLKGFIDIHCHILPGLDDGPSTIEESLKMAKMYASQGVHHVIATPHFINGTAWANSAKIVVQSVQKMQAVLNKNRINLIIHPGMEIACSFRMPDFCARYTFTPWWQRQYVSAGTSLPWYAGRTCCISPVYAAE